MRVANFKYSCDIAVITILYLYIHTLTYTVHIYIHIVTQILFTHVCAYVHVLSLSGLLSFPDMQNLKAPHP